MRMFFVCTKTMQKSPKKNKKQDFAQNCLNLWAWFKKLSAKPHNLQNNLYTKY